MEPFLQLLLLSMLTQVRVFFKRKEFAPKGIATGSYKVCLPCKNQSTGSTGGLIVSMYKRENVPERGFKTVSFNP